MIEELKKGGSIYDTNIIGVNREFKEETGKMSIGIVYQIDGRINKVILDGCVTTSKLALLICKNENLYPNNIVDIKNSQVIDSINETINWMDKTTNELNDRIWAHNTCGVIKNAADEAAEFHKNRIAVEQNDITDFPKTKDFDYTQMTNAYSKLIEVVSDTDAAEEALIAFLTKEGIKPIHTDKGITGFVILKEEV